MKKIGFLIVLLVTCFSCSSTQTIPLFKVYYLIVFPEMEMDGTCDIRETLLVISNGYKDKSLDLMTEFSSKKEGVILKKGSDKSFYHPLDHCAGLFSFTEEGVFISCKVFKDSVPICLLKKKKLEPNTINIIEVPVLDI